MATEKRLIDANVLRTQFEDIPPFIGLTAGCVQQYIDKAPTVDAVEVVRCGKCLYRSQYPDENGDYKCGGVQTEDGELLLMVKPDFFCACGERRGKDAVD